MQAYTSRSRRRGRSQGANMHSGFGNTRAKHGQARQSFRPSLVGTATEGKGSLAPAKPGVSAGPSKPPATPAKPPVGHPASPDSLYYRQVDLANRQQESRLGQLAGQEQSIRHDFGIEDPTNPFSRVEGMKRAFLARQKATSAMMASEGHLYSGAHERALARTRLEEEQARAELRKQYDAVIGQIGAQEAGVKFDTEEQKNQAFEDWLARAPDSTAPPAPPLPKPAPVDPKTGVTPGTTPAQPGKPAPNTPANQQSGNMAEGTLPGQTTLQGGVGDIGTGSGSPVNQRRIHHLRQELRKARQAGNKARVKKLRARIKRLSTPR